MPIFNYKCLKCEESFQKMIKTKEFSPQTNALCECGGEAEFQLSPHVHSRSYETTNKYKGKSQMKDLDKMLRKRYKQHLYKYDAGEIIDKYGPKDANARGLMSKQKKI